VTLLGCADRVKVKGKFRVPVTQMVRMRLFTARTVTSKFSTVEVKLTNLSAIRKGSDIYFFNFSRALDLPEEGRGLKREV
jgi:hypothetical protein